MKKGYSALQVIIVMIIMLLFAGGVLFGVVPRYDKGSDFVDTLLPEVCQETGKTKQEYESMIFDALTALEPNSKKALALTEEMHRCFTDTKLPEGLKEGMHKLLVPELNSLRNSPKLSSLQTVLRIYDQSKGVIMGEEWSPDELLLFARALYHLRPESKDLLPLLESVRKHKKSENQHKAESFAMEGLVLSKYAGTGEAYEMFEDADKYDNPELFVGISKLGIGEYDEGIELLENARKSAPSGDGTYESYGAAYYIFMHNVQMNKKREAALFFENNMKPNIPFQSSVFYKSSMKTYSQIAETDRTFKNCAVGEKARYPECVCLPIENTILPPAYCCSGFTSDLPCSIADCKSVSGCSSYPDEETCGKDPCKQGTFITTRAGATGYCYWDGSCKVRRSP